MLTSEARLALLAISRQFPNGAEVLRHEIETKDAEIERLRAALRDCIQVLVVFDTDTDRIIAIEHVVNTALEAHHA
jgi:hypothetical protein